MSDSPGQINQQDALSKRADSLQQDVKDLIAAQSQVRNTRLLLLLLLIGFVSGTCYAFYGLVAKFQQKEHLDLLVQKAQDRLAKKNDLLVKDVQALVDHSAPVISKAFYDQAKKDTPAFLQAIGSEREKLVEDLQAKLSKRLIEHHEKMVARHQKLLKQEFPAIEDEHLHEAMTANLQIAADALVQKYYIEELKTEFLALYGLWDEFPPAPPADKGDLPIEDQLVANLLELLKGKLAETSPTSLVAGEQEENR